MTQLKRNQEDQTDSKPGKVDSATQTTDTATQTRSSLPTLDDKGQPSKEPPSSEIWVCYCNMLFLIACIKLYGYPAVPTWRRWFFFYLAPATFPLPEEIARVQAPLMRRNFKTYLTIHHNIDVIMSGGCPVIDKTWAMNQFLCVLGGELLDRLYVHIDNGKSFWHLDTWRGILIGCSDAVAV